MDKRPCKEKHPDLIPDICHFCWLATYSEKHTQKWMGRAAVKKEKGSEWIPAAKNVFHPGDEPRSVVRPSLPPRGLGDQVEKALTIVGITKERVEAFVGGPCGCKERKERLNQLGAWAKRILNGATEKAKEYLDGIIGGK